MARVLFVLAAIGVTIYAAIECLRSNDDEIRILPKPLWLLFIVVVPLVGGLTWIFFGSETATGQRSRSRVRAVGPDDDPEFLRTLDIRRHKRDDEDG